MQPPREARPARQRPGNQQTLVALNFRVPFEFRQRLKVAATNRGVTMTELVVAALESDLSAHAHVRVHE